MKPDRFFGILLPILCSFHFSTLRAQDTCLAHDLCQDAIFIGTVFSDAPLFRCIDGCNKNASAESAVSNCGFDEFPTVWYKMQTDSIAHYMYIELTSDSLESITIGFFQETGNCAEIFPVAITPFGTSCLQGFHGSVQMVDLIVEPNTSYYFAISANQPTGGDFALCVKTSSDDPHCLISGDIKVTDRSHTGSLEGPFFPGEKISVCMNVNEYSASSNSCQWFQGIIPKFGNGWDPSSFDSLGQPLNFTINGQLGGLQGNGVYGNSTWDWFSNAGLHYHSHLLQFSDLDGNGSVEFCHFLFEENCPDLGGYGGGCCAPCWDDPGQILPPGWFAYGINGSCAMTAPPIYHDWGDGNSCNSQMGPWSFCFDLFVRDFSDCSQGGSLADLSLGFIALADGQTGAWTGGPSSCILDEPVLISLSLDCVGFIVDIPPDESNDKPVKIDPPPPGSNFSEQIIENRSTKLNTQMLKVYPVPSKDEVVIQCTDLKADDGQLNVYNVHGQLVDELKINAQFAQRNVINISSYPAGVYIVTMISNGKMYTTRLVKI